MSRFGDAVNQQVANEFAASQQYVAIAVHYDAQTLPNLAAHFYRQALEERNHAMMLVQYLLDADEDVQIPGVAAPRTDFARRRLARRARARAGARGDGADQGPRPDRARGRRARRRAVPLLVPRGAARGGLVDERAARDRAAGRRGERAPPRGRAGPRRRVGRRTARRRRAPPAAGGAL